MTEIYLPAFFLGAQEELEKHSAMSVDSMPLNENILPTISKQTKWKYVRTKDGLKLTDGNLVYSFGGLPEEYPAEDFKLSRTADDNILNFEKDAIGKGTAQIHRASPDNIYMTLANGANNPTFMLQHEGGKNWRYSPSKKFLQKLKAISASMPPADQTIQALPEQMIEGGQEAIKQAMLESSPALGAGFMDLDSLTSAIGKGVGKATDSFNWMGAHPVATGIGTYAASRALTPAQNKNREALLPLTLSVLAPMAISAFAKHNQA